VSRKALGPAQQPIQWVPGAISLGITRPRVKLTTHIHLVARSKTSGAIPPLPNMPSWRVLKITWTTLALPSYRKCRYV